MNHVRITADGAVFDILLDRTGGEVDRHDDLFAAMPTQVARLILHGGTVDRECFVSEETVEVFRMRQGRYRHYKGKHYIVLGVARHSETDEPMVVYRTDYGRRDLWVRPMEMFEETVDFDGRQVPRFEYVGEF